VNPPDPFSQQLSYAVEAAVSEGNVRNTISVEVPTTMELGTSSASNGLTGVSVPDGFAWVTVKLRVTGVAALKVPLPPWLAVIKHSPAPGRMTGSLAVLQTAGVVELRATGRPELACAATTNAKHQKSYSKSDRTQSSVTPPLP
jgi:hypothetical protein